MGFPKGKVQAPTLINKCLLGSLPDTGCKSQPDGHGPEHLPSLQLGRHHKTRYGKKEPGGCETGPDSLGQPGDSQVGSGSERKSVSGKRNSIVKDEREGERGKGRERTYHALQFSVADVSSEERESCKR